MSYLIINIIILNVSLWIIPLKIYAAWVAVKNNQDRWFIALLLINTFAILEFFYLFKIAKKSWVDIKKDFKGALTEIK